MPSQPSHLVLDLPKESANFGRLRSLFSRFGHSTEPPMSSSVPGMAAFIASEDKPWESPAEHAGILERARSWIGVPRDAETVDLGVLEHVLDSSRGGFEAWTWDANGPLGGPLTLPIGGTDDKSAILARVEALLGSKLDLPGRLVNEIITAADELILNAIFDSPLNPATGEQLHARIPRDARISTPPDRPSHFEIGTLAEGRWIGVSAIDSFGSIDFEKVARLISRNFKTSRYQPEPAHEGAEIGLSSVLKKGGSVIIHRVPDKATRVTVLFPVTSEIRKLRACLQLLCFF